jgi:hypothetical protein
VLGGFICLGIFLVAVLAGIDAGFPYVHWHRMRNASASLTNFFRDFQSTSRANPFAQKILKAVIDQGLNSSISQYAPDNCKLSWMSFSWGVTSMPLQGNSGP